MLYLLCLYDIILKVVYFLPGQFCFHVGSNRISTKTGAFYDWMNIGMFAAFAPGISWAALLISMERLNPEPYLPADPEPI